MSDKFYAVKQNAFLEATTEYDEIINWYTTLFNNLSVSELVRKIKNFLNGQEDATIFTP